MIHVAKQSGAAAWSLVPLVSYRPAGEPIDPRRYEVAAIASDRTAKDFVLPHHYSGSYPAARFRFGLFRRAVLDGVDEQQHASAPAHRD